MRLLKTILLLAIAALVSGCTTCYWKDRGRDAADVFTASVGTGLGAKARVGPLALGLQIDVGSTGLRGGAFLNGGMPPHPGDTLQSERPNSFDLQVLLWGYEEFSDPKCWDRAKTHMVDPSYTPVWIPRGTRAAWPDQATSRHPASYYTQIEACVGLFGSLRIGFNPGELLDFLLGFVGIDLYHDDLGH